MRYCLRIYNMQQNTFFSTTTQFFENTIYNLVKYLFILCILLSSIYYPPLYSSSVYCLTTGPWHPTPPSSSVLRPPFSIFIWCHNQIIQHPFFGLPLPRFPSTLPSITSLTFRLPLGYVLPNTFSYFCLHLITDFFLQLYSELLYWLFFLCR
jgi:hypothetical protein